MTIQTKFDIGQTVLLWDTPGVLIKLKVAGISISVVGNKPITANSAPVMYISYTMEDFFRPLDTTKPVTLSRDENELYVSVEDFHQVMGNLAAHARNPTEPHPEPNRVRGKN